MFRVWQGWEDIKVAERMDKLQLTFAMIVAV